MSIDLGKLSPAPWTAHPNELIGGWAVYAPGQEFGGGQSVADLCDEATATAIALARNAFDVMIRRGWYAVPRLADGSEWIAINAFCVQIERGGNTGTYFIAADPFTCLVEADRWMVGWEAKHETPAAAS